MEKEISFVEEKKRRKIFGEGFLWRRRKRRKLLGEEKYFLWRKRRMEKEKEKNIIEKEKLSRVDRQHGTEIEGSTRSPHGPKTG